MSTLVSPVHAVPTVSVEKLTAKQFARAFRHILDHLRDVDQSVSQVPSVPWIERASIKNVLILAREHAGPIHVATLITTVPFVLVKPDILEIRLQDAIRIHVRIYIHLYFKFVLF